MTKQSIYKTNKVSIVVGLGFGDEGKGVTTSFLARQSLEQKESAIVVRFNGGQQAGHTVVSGKLKHVFSSFGSGTFRSAPTYISKYCTFDPSTIQQEYLALKKLNINIPKLYIDPLAMLTLPIDVHNGIDKELKNMHGTTAMGVGETVHRNENHFRIIAMDLLYPDVFRAKLENINKYWKEFRHIDLYVKDIYEILKNVSEIIIAKPVLHDYNHVILEGAQGILLDQQFGFFPNVTRSYTTSRNAINIWKDAMLLYQPTVYYVSRLYQTRHGNGPMTNEELLLELVNTEGETNKDDGPQGKFRKTVLDLNLLEYAIKCDLNYSRYCHHNLVFTCADQIPDLNKIQVTYKDKVKEKTIKQITSILERTVDIDYVLKNSSPESNLEIM